MRSSMYAPSNFLAVRVVLDFPYFQTCCCWSKIMLALLRVGRFISGTIP